MPWNYRVVKRGTYYAVYEVHYNEALEIIGTSVEPCSPEADSVAELRDTLGLMGEALEKPALIEDEHHIAEE